MGPELRGALYSAYSSGEAPIFVSVLPGGWDELWRLKNLLLVMPVVPADASPELELAMRIRRDALTSGECPNCEAVASIDTTVAKDGTMGSALFNHKRRCPGRDDNVKQLRAAHIRRVSDLTTEERIDAASAQTRALVDPLRSSSNLEMRAPGSNEVTLEILDSLTPPANNKHPCPHLASDPYQPWNVLIADGNWRCNQCWAYFEEEIKKGFRLDPLEDFTCDICRKYAPKSIAPLALRVGTFFMRGGACGHCMSRYSNRQEVSDDEAAGRK